MDEKRQPAPGDEYGISKLDCLSICVILHHAMDQDRLRELLAPMISDCCRHRLANPIHLLQMAHSASHNKGLFAKTISRELNRRYKEFFSYIDKTDVDEILEDFRSDKGPSLDEPVGLAWALMTSDDEQKQAVGHVVIHSLFLNQDQARTIRTMDCRRIHLEHQCEGLQRLLDEKQNEIDTMLNYIHRMKRGAKTEILDDKKEF